LGSARAARGEDSLIADLDAARNILELARRGVHAASLLDSIIVSLQLAIDDLVLERPPAPQMSKELTQMTDALSHMLVGDVWN
jgi:hypothetical protein